MSAKTGRKAVVDMSADELRVDQLVYVLECVVGMDATFEARDEARKLMADAFTVWAAGNERHALGEAS